VKAVEAAITPRTKAVMPVHYAGLAADMPALLALAKRHGLKVVEDAAHSLPTTHHGKLVGALDTDAAVFSFYATKTLATGEGGMIVTRNPAVAARCRVMRLHGIDRDVFNRYVSDKPSWHYDVVAPGFKYNMTDLAASLGIHQLRKVRWFQQTRQEMAARYDDAFRDLPVTLPPRAPDGDTHAWHLYVLRLRPEAPCTRDRFIEQLAAQGIGTSVHFIPLHLHPYWRETYGLRPEDYPAALAAYESAVSLPLYTRMTRQEQERVIASVRRVLAG
jgi:dTDP-4-amino-4,6-dideoxygalactose transaminase